LFANLQLLASWGWAWRRRRILKKARDPTTGRPTVGGIYSVIPGSTSFAVVQVVEVEESIVHVRVLQRRFGWRPPGAASLSRSWGISHLALSMAEFARWQPLLLCTKAIPIKSLEAYRMWQESRGGVWR
jgi:hypothetical protein